MGIEFTLVLEKDIDGFSPNSISPTYLFRWEEKFAPIIAAKNLTPFNSFFRKQKGQWFSAAEGLRSVRGCLEYLLEDPRTELPDPIVDALAEIDSTLEAAAQHGVGFHFWTTRDDGKYSDTE